MIMREVGDPEKTGCMRREVARESGTSRKRCPSRDGNGQEALWFLPTGS